MFSWELNLLKFIGFDLNISEYCKYEIIDNKKNILLKIHKKN